MAPPPSRSSTGPSYAVKPVSGTTPARPKLAPRISDIAHTQEQAVRQTDRRIAAHRSNRKPHAHRHIRRVLDIHALVKVRERRVNRQISRRHRGHFHAAIHADVVAHEARIGSPRRSFHPVKNRQYQPQSGRCPGALLSRCKRSSHSKTAIPTAAQSTAPPRTASRRQAKRNENPFVGILATEIPRVRASAAVRNSKLGRAFDGSSRSSSIHRTVKY